LSALPRTRGPHQENIHGFNILKTMNGKR
jgi:hypothetical protein